MTGTPRIPQSRLGVVVRPQLPPEDLRRVAAAAEAAEVAHVWLWEDCFLEGGFSSAAAVLAWTEKVNVHVGVFPVPLRNTAITAMEIATLARMFPGRFHPGFGHGVQSWMEQVGARVASPLTLLTESIGALRTLLAGGEVDSEGRYVTLRGVRLDWPPTIPPTLTVAATGPKTLELSGRVGDATVLTAGTTPEQVRAARALVEVGRQASSRDGAPHVVVYLTCATGSDASTRVSAELTATDATPESAAIGTADDVAEVVRRYHDAGADSVVLQPTPDEPDIEGFVGFTASVDAELQGACA